MSDCLRCCGVEGCDWSFSPSSELTPSSEGEAGLGGPGRYGKGSGVGVRSKDLKGTSRWVE